MDRQAEARVAMERSCEAAGRYFSRLESAVTANDLRAWSAAREFALFGELQEKGSVRQRASCPTARSRSFKVGLTRLRRRGQS